MRGKIAMLALLGVVMCGSAFAAPDEYDDSQSHPLRVAAYVAHPIGYALEWAIFRPFHWLVSRDETEEVFGHVPHGTETEVYGAAGR
jgi:hypothetical protein